MMSAMSIAFYAMPDEQRAWLDNVLCDEHVWCVYERWPDAVYKPIARALPGDFEFRGAESNHLSIFLGRRDIGGQPVWETISTGRVEIDFIRSRAVQYVPSLVTPNDILLEGRLAIMNSVYYDEVGVDPSGLQRWFRDLVKSFRSLQKKSATLIHRSTDGTTTEYRKELVTHGAFEWRRDGRRLKQLAVGNVEFEVRTDEDSRSSL